MFLLCVISQRQGIGRMMLNFLFSPLHFCRDNITIIASGQLHIRVISGSLSLANVAAESAVSLFPIALFIPIAETIPRKKSPWREAKGDLLVGKFLSGSPAGSMTDTLVELARYSPDCEINNPELSFVQLAKSISQSKNVSFSAAQTETLFIRSG